MATIQGRECEVIGWADTGLYCITSKHGGGRLNERLEWNHDVMSNFCLSFPTEAAAQACIEQHADKPATPAAESDSGEIERLRTELAAARAERDAAVGVLARLPHTADGVPVICDGMTLFCPKGHGNKLTPGCHRVYCCTGECWDDGCQGDSGSGTGYPFDMCYATAKGAGRE